MSISPGYTGHPGTTAIATPPSGLPTHSMQLPGTDADGLDLLNAGGFNIDRQHYTISCWIKDHVGTNSGAPFIFGGWRGDRTDVYDSLRWFATSNLFLWIYVVNTGDTRFDYRALNLANDLTDWTHVVVHKNSLNVTPSERLRIWVDGVQASMEVRTEMPSGEVGLWGGVPNFNSRVGVHVHTAIDNFEGRYYDLHCVDGDNVAPTEFAEDDGGVWKPKEYTGSHGNAGWRWDFEDDTNMGKNVASTTQQQPDAVEVGTVTQSTDTPPLT